MGRTVRRGSDGPSRTSGTEVMSDKVTSEGVMMMRNATSQYPEALEGEGGPESFREREMTILKSNRE